ncbi:alpha/beta fold hydrolase [Mucilaginibacter sp. X4EP1]|uniref:alpha/beta fold hydrolase n=1 Tax=Mucilaginibacter sp. X4EP1 TaxID=2723092 RepID=UPI00216A4A00|nr:alpha/beta hydrolase [Mucilaginibacter sp. X4EP1]MCS3814517.1 pimeloyl-ACP methyl ester carboxylesterase [Mucilaginibacter sp. X4EP1]
MKKQTIYYKTINVDGINIFYREAGDKTKPQIVLLNGVPNASSAFQELIHDLKEDFYLIAPDFPGFGNSDIPDKGTYAYTFHNISLSIEKFIDQLGLTHPSVYALGYGGPITFRIALRRPDLFANYILQNSNAYEEGLGPAMLNAAPFLENRHEETEKLVKPLLTLDGIKLFFLNGAKDATAINPDGYLNSLYYLSRPGQEEIQLDLLYDYRTNIGEYQNWQQFLKDRQPRMLLVWGKNDVFFPLAAAEAIKKDVPSAELHVYDTSHLALEEHHYDIAERIKTFLIK